MKLFRIRNTSVHINDLFQVSWIKFIDCLEKYDEKSGKLYTFIQLSLNRNFSDFLKHESKRIINYSLDEYLDEEAGISFLDTIHEDPLIYNLDNEVIANEVMETLLLVLSKLEKNILEDKIKGYSYKELSSKYNKNYKAIDNHLNKIRKKIKEVL